MTTVLFKLVGYHYESYLSAGDSFPMRVCSEAIKDLFNVPLPSHLYITAHKTDKRPSKEWMKVTWVPNGRYVGNHVLRIGNKRFGVFQDAYNVLEKLKLGPFDVKSFYVLFGFVPIKTN